jgi:RNA polymerase sigma-B factor
MHASEDELFERYQTSRDPACRETLITRFLPLARRLAGHYACGGEPYDDLFQVASVGLLNAIDRYDPRRGTSFMSYAVPTIHGAIRRHYRDATWSVRIPHSVHDLAMRLRRVRDPLTGEYGRSPTVAELADVVGAGEEDVLEALDVLTANKLVSLELPTGDDRTLGDELGDIDAAYDRVEQRAVLNDLFRCLSDQEQHVVALRFYEDLTQREIGQRLGVSQMAVSRLLKVALPRLCEVAERRST